MRLRPAPFEHTDTDWLRVLEMRTALTDAAIFRYIASTVGFGMYHAHIKSRDTQQSPPDRIDNLPEIWDGPSVHFNVQSYRLYASV